MSLLHSALSLAPPLRTLVCFSHLPWVLIRQRPQHLLSRFATDMEVLYFETPVYGLVTEQGDGSVPYTHVSQPAPNVRACKPVLPAGGKQTEEERNKILADLVRKELDELASAETGFWYYDAAAFAYTGQLRPAITVYDCMAEPEGEAARQAEIDLLMRADVVFASSESLYRSRKSRSNNIFVFTCSTDMAHFMQARQPLPEPEDQAVIPHPRLGFYGMIGPHFASKLIARAAALQPNWHFVLIGPVTEETLLPKGPNIHYLGTKSYEELPAYLAGWDLALAPYREDTLTETVMPAKIPEYLAAGVRVVSAPITDVVQQYGRQGLVQMASSLEIFVNVAASLLEDSEKEKASWLQLVDKELATRSSWDRTQQKMVARILESLDRKRRRRAQSAATAAS